MSGTPQARKLGLKAGLRVDLDSPPDGWALTEPPAGLLAPDEDGAADVILAFFHAADLIPGRLPGLAERIFPAGAVWALWPRRAAGHDSDITDSVVRACALGLGLVDVKVAAVDENWSGLRLVWRPATRGHAPVALPAPEILSPPRPEHGRGNICAAVSDRRHGIRGRGEGGFEPSARDE